MRILLLGSLTLLFTLNSKAGIPFKSTTGTLRVLTQEAYNSLDKGSQPVCIKDGGRAIEMNAAYNKIIGNNKKPCAASPATQRMNKVNYGTEVIVLKVAELPDAEIKRLSK